ncbi:MAG: hypothetical protein ACHQT7_02880 [Candidatus Levyibacteriota bacterium]
MPTLIEQQVRYNRDITVPLAEVPPGEKLTFPFISLAFERMNFLVDCTKDDQRSDLFIVGEEDIDRQEGGLIVIRNSTLIPISSLRSGQYMVFQLRRKPELPVAEIKVSHV